MGRVRVVLYARHVDLVAQPKERYALRRPRLNGKGDDLTPICNSPPRRPPPFAAFAQWAEVNRVQPRDRPTKSARR